MNELDVNVNVNEDGEMIPNNNLVLVESTPDYDKYYNQDTKKYVKDVKYQDYSTFNPQTEEEKKKLFIIMNDQESNYVIPFKRMVDKTFDIKNIKFTPYQAFDEDTGLSSNGVTIMVEDSKGKFYATSSKTAYYNLKAIFVAFGFPDETSYKPIKVKVTATKSENGETIGCSLAL